MRTLILLLISSCSYAGFYADMDTDMDCLVAAVYFEARDQPIIGQMGVAHVIRNRLDHPRYEDTICGVVKRKWAFSFYWDGKPEYVDDVRAWQQAQESALLAWTARFDLTDGATLYYNPSIVKEFPWDITKVIHTVTINDHWWYREK